MLPQPEEFKLGKNHPPFSKGGQGGLSKRPIIPLIPGCDRTGNLAFVGADLCVRPGMRAHTQVRPYRSRIFLTSMSATWYKSPFKKGGLRTPVPSPPSVERKSLQHKPGFATGSKDKNLITPQRSDHPGPKIRAAGDHPRPPCCSLKYLALLAPIPGINHRAWVIKAPLASKTSISTVRPPSRRCVAQLSHGS
jgi:hypothetical protein